MSLTYISSARLANADEVRIAKLDSKIVLPLTE